ncbi:MAG: GNAT family N-acetyltransferase [Chitinophagales bacterium]
MNLETKRLKIVALKHTDISDIHLMNSFESVARYNTIGIPSDISETEKMLLPILEEQEKENPTKFVWTIRKRENDEFLGEVGMNLSSKKYNRGEIYYSLLPKYWGKGYATEVTKRIIIYGFEVLKLHRIEAGVATENAASIRLLEKIGMIREGLRRKVLPIRGTWKDNYMYAILEEDKRDY